ncbi:MAG: Ig-like domain-containing protein [Myxococcales bacterium]|nr:Ig-like domain-containing protein [Myxococcales bacterium]
MLPVPPSRSLSVICSALAALGLFAACGATEAPVEGDPDAATTPTDTEAPTVVSATPGADAVGVLADASIVITFSEPMDAPSVAAAYASPELPADQVSLSWNATGDVLTIVPAMPLAYATGVGVNPATVTAMRYAVTVGSAATDRAGNPLAAPFELGFTTKKRIRTAFAVVADLTRVARNGVLLAVANPLWMGDNNTGETYQSFVTFDLARLPSGIEVERAEIAASQLAPTGLPYSMGALLADHISYASAAVAPTTLPLASIGPFSTNATREVKRLDVTSQAREDLANWQVRGGRSQYRLRFAQATNGNASTDTAVFDKDSVSFEILYLAD